MGSWVTLPGPSLPPGEDGTYYIAVGAGAQAPGGTGFYTLTVRVDDHPDDYGLNPGVVLQPGESDHRCDRQRRRAGRSRTESVGLGSIRWRRREPVFGVESLDDRDVFRLEISEEGTYKMSVSDGPTGRRHLERDSRPHMPSSPTVPGLALWSPLVLQFEPGTYHVEVGTPYLSEGNVGSYTVSLDVVDGRRRGRDSRIGGVGLLAPN